MNSLRKKIESKKGKQFYFEYNNKTKVAVLTGLVQRDSKYYYVFNNGEYLIPITNSITELYEN